MSYAVGRGPNGDFQVVLSGEPPNCKPLSMAPEEMEPELKHGAWLILLVAVWSAPDRDAIRTALEVAKEFSNGFQVGLRIFDHYYETLAW
jgi:hypothetical protein